MNTKHFGMLGAVALAVAGLAWTPDEAQAQAFGITNQINSGVTLISWPTNSSGTNGLYQSTGGALDISQATGDESVGFNVSGMLSVNTNAANAGGAQFQLVRAWCDTPPRVLYTTNGVLYQNDWETSAFITLTAPFPAGTNAFSWGTNLNAAVLGGANWLGIYLSTNTGGAGTTFTNVAVRGNVKLPRVRLK